MPVERTADRCRSFKQRFFVFGPEATKRAGTIALRDSGANITGPF